MITFSNHMGRREGNKKENKLNLVYCFSLRFSEYAGKMIFYKQSSLVSLVGQCIWTPLVVDPRGLF